MEVCAVLSVRAWYKGTSSGKSWAAAGTDPQERGVRAGGSLCPQRISRVSRGSACGRPESTKGEGHEGQWGEKVIEILRGFIGEHQIRAGLSWEGS